MIQFTTSLDRVKSIQKDVSDTCNSLVFSIDCVPSICPAQNRQCPKSGVVTSVPTPRQPKTIFDYQPWFYFDSATFYPDQMTQPTYGLKIKKDIKEELKQVMSEAVQVASAQYGRQLKLKSLLSGWMRHNPFVGNEYIVDMLLLDGTKKTVTKRVSLVQPLASNYITVKESAKSSQELINMVVPITKVSDRFRRFMTMYETLVLKGNERVKLVLSVYGEEDVKFVSDVVKSYRVKYPSALITVLEGKGAFSRSKALHFALTHLRPSELAFICDIDMEVTHPFLNHCRRNTIQGSRVYYPEFFKWYNLNYVYWNKPRPHKMHTLRREHGHWAYYSFGMLCIYKSDYDRVGGMDTNIEGWGDEDVHFFNKVVRKHLNVMRSPDPGLSHHWHEKMCSQKLSRRQHKHCLSSQQENLADRKELARYIYELGVEIKERTGGSETIATIEEESEQDYNFK